MKMIMRIQLTFFCDYHIQTSVESITELMEGLNELKIYELLPSVVQGQKLDLLAGKAISTTNLSFSSTDGKVQMTCMDNRIDCTVKTDIGETINKDDILSNCKSLLNVVLQKYSILGNRLAVNIDALGSEIGTDFKNTKYGNALISCLDFYNDKDLNDLSVQLNTQIPIIISDIEEIVNIITNINSAINNQNQKKVLIYHIDINTAPENQGLRFKGEDLSDFIQQINDSINQILSDFEVRDNE